MFNKPIVKEVCSKCSARLRHEKKYQKEDREQVESSMEMSGSVPDVPRRFTFDEMWEKGFVGCNCGAIVGKPPPQFCYMRLEHILSSQKNLAS